MYRCLNNGEKVFRSWLVYSISKDAVYCFPCKLFSSSSKFATTGCSNWIHLARNISNHEKSQDHFHSMHQFLIRRNSSASFTSLERAMLRGHNAEVQHWRDVLTRLLSCIKYLAEHDIAIHCTGGHEYLGDQKNGSFLSLVELVATYDVVLAEHLNRIKLRKNSDHYLGKNIQNEFIQLLGDKVLEEIISQIKQDRYYNFNVVIHEHFTGFIVVKNSTSSALTKLLLQRLTEMGLDIQNCKDKDMIMEQIWLEKRMVYKNVYLN